MVTNINVLKSKKEGWSDYASIYQYSFVTGGGWIDSPAGAYISDHSLAGRAGFGFVSKYRKGANVPSGQTEFQFEAGSFYFESETYNWLVVAGTRAQFKGTGAVNGVSGYSFLLTLTDGQINGGGGADKFRVKVWYASGVIYVEHDRLLGGHGRRQSSDDQRWQHRHSQQVKCVTAEGEAG